jgi:hypothetical protein
VVDDAGDPTHGTNTGQSVAAAVPEQVVVVHPSATVARLLAAHYTETIHTSMPNTNTATDTATA